MNRILWYFRVFGIQGLLIACIAAVTRNPVKLKIYSAKLGTWVAIRTKTSDLAVYEKVVVNEEYKIPESIEPETIVDAGANIGISAVYFAVSYPAARVIAIEPEISNFGMLKDNISSHSRIEAVQAAMWNENTMLNLFGEMNSDFQVSQEEGTGEVEGITFDELMERFSLDSIDVLKVDIEGAEKEVFASSGKWLDKVGMLVIELHDRFKPGCRKAVMDAAVGFNNTWECGENSFFARSPDG